MAPRTPAGDTVKTDETVIFFPTGAWLDEAADVWRLPVHGWIFEPEEDSHARKALIESLASVIELPPQGDNALFRERARYFLVDNERGKRLRVRAAGVHALLEPSAPNGHFQGVLSLSREQVRAALRTLDCEGRWLEVEATLREGDARRFVGHVQFIAPTGVSLISDIDDTIKISEVGDKRALMQRTFLRPFEAFDTVADAYTRLSDDGVTIHYVSASPWQLYPALDAFFRQVGLPRGSMHLRDFRWKDKSLLEIIGSSKEHKLAAIDELITRYPGRKFILVGDSGEADPEIYGEIFRRHPDNVLHILIRNVSEEIPDLERYVAALGHVPRFQWTVFERAGNIPRVRFEDFLHGDEQR